MSLDGKRVVFTGALSMTRKEATKLASDAGRAADLTCIVLIKLARSSLFPRRSGASRLEA